MKKSIISTFVIILMWAKVSLAGTHMQQGDAAGGALSGTYPNPSLSGSGLPSGSTNYIQNTGNPTVSDQVFNVSSGTIGTGGEFFNGILTVDRPDLGIGPFVQRSALTFNPNVSTPDLDLNIYNGLAIDNKLSLSYLGTTYAYITGNRLGPTMAIYVSSASGVSPIIRWAFDAVSIGQSFYDGNSAEVFRISNSSASIRSGFSLQFGDSDNSNFVGFKSAPVIASNVNWILPSADASGCWKSDGAGNLSVSACGSGGDNLGNHIATMTLTAGYGINTSTIVVNNSSTQRGIYLNQTGNPGISYWDGSKGGSLVVDKNTISGDGLVVISSQPTQGSIESLAHLVSLTTSYNEIMLWIQSNSTSTIGANADIRIDANNPDIEFEETDKLSAGTGNGKWEIAVNFDQLQFNQRNAADTSFQTLGAWARDGSLRFKELDNGGDFVAFICTQTLSGSFEYTLPSNNPSEGDSLHTHAFAGSGYNMYWVSDVHVQDTLQDGATFYVPKGTIQTPLAANATSFFVHQQGSTAQAVRIVNEGTGNSLYVEQDADAGNSSGSSGNIFINNTFNPGTGFQMYTSHVAPTSSLGLMYLTATATSYSQPILRINQSGTGNGIKIAQSGGTSFTDGTSGAVLIDNSDNIAPGLQVFSSTGATAIAPLIYVSESSNTFAQPLIYGKQVANSASAVILRADSPAPAIQWVETDQSTPAGKWLMQLNGDVFQMQGRNGADNGYSAVTKLTRVASSGGASLAIQTTGQLRLDDGDDSNYVAFRASNTVASNVVWTLPAADGSNGQALTTNGSGVLTFSTVVGSGDNLGNHVATTTLNMATFGISNIGSGASAFDSGGSLRINTSPNSGDGTYSSLFNSVTPATIERPYAMNKITHQKLTGDINSVVYGLRDNGGEDPYFAIEAYDSGTGVRFSTGLFHLDVSTSSSSRGFLGLGVTTPTANLDIASNIRVRSSGTIEAILSVGTSTAHSESTAFIYSNDPNKVVLIVRDAGGSTSDPTGNVDIQQWQNDNGVNVSSVAKDGSFVTVSSVTGRFGIFNHVEISSGAPTISSCGSTPSGSVVGNDQVGKITVGGGVVTSCTLTFAKAWLNEPACNITGSSFITGQAATTNTTTLTISGSATFSGDVLMYQCFGYR